MKKILNNYNLKIKEIKEFSKGYASKKWNIIDKFGNSYILKRIDKQDKDRINFILKVQSKLNDYSAPIERTLDNKLFIEIDNSIYYINKFLKSKDLTITESTISLCGEFLGKLHSEMQKINIEYSEFLKIEDNIEILKKYYEEHLKEGHDDYTSIIEYKLNILSNINVKNNSFDKLEKQIIHGDFYLDNILNTEEGYKIIDFDQSCYFYKEYEILRAMFMLCLGDEKNINNIINKMNLFIEGYKKYNTLEYPTLAYELYLYIQANSLSSINPKDYNNPMKKEFAKKRYNILKFLFTYKERIIEVLKGSENMRQPKQVLVLPFKHEDDNILYGIFYREDLKVWQGIAGGVEEGEDILEAGKREAYEEAKIPYDSKYIPLDSISTIPVNFIHGNFYWGEDIYNVKEHCFGVCADNVDIVLSEEHTMMKWVPYEEAFNLFKWDSNRNALWELNERIKKKSKKR